MRRICVSAFVLSLVSIAALSSALADPFQVTVYPYGGQPVAQPPQQQYYYYVQQPRYVAAPAYYGQPQDYAPNYAPGYAPRYTVAPPDYAPAAPRYAVAPQGYAPAAPQTYAAVAPQVPAAVAPQPAPQPVAAAGPADAGGGGFLHAIFGGPTINVPAAQIYPYEAPQPQPQARAPVQQASYNPSNPIDETNYPIDAQFMRQVVAYNGDEKPGTIIVDTPDKFLFLIEEGGRALRYGIGVGRPGFTWSGVKTITAKKE
ncbi:MAG: hypothetical protein WA280_12740, partial [Xanthobacteraceae bacterium]